MLETLLQLRGRVGAVVVPRSSRGNLCDPSLALCLKRAGLPVMEVNDFGEVEFPGGKVVATPFLGEHADLDIRAKSTSCCSWLARRYLWARTRPASTQPCTGTCTTMSAASTWHSWAWSAPGRR